MYTPCISVSVQFVMKIKIYGNEKKNSIRCYNSRYIIRNIQRNEKKTPAQYTTVPRPLKYISFTGDLMHKNTYVFYIQFFFIISFIL